MVTMSFNISFDTDDVILVQSMMNKAGLKKVEATEERLKEFYERKEPINVNLSQMLGKDGQGQLPELCGFFMGLVQSYEAQVEEGKLYDGFENNKL